MNRIPMGVTEAKESGLDPSLARHAKLLRHWPQWKWISRFESCGRMKIRHARHLAWMKANQEQHGSREVMFVLGGRHFYGAQGRVFRATPGTVLLIDKHEPHDARYSPYQPECRDIWLHLISAHELIAHNLAHRGKRTFVTARRTLQGPFVECLSESWDACSAGDTSPLALARLRAAVVMALMHLLMMRSARPDTSRFVAHQKAVIAQIQKYIQNHLNDNLSLHVLARLAGYEAGHFHRLFRHHTGDTLRRYVNRHRLQRARTLLREGRTTQSVAEELGFGTAAYFCRFFRQASGCSPLEWKQRAERSG